MEKLDICVVVTSYKPTDHLWSHYNLILESVRGVVIVDNTPGGISRPDYFAGFLVSGGVNMGLGAALNIGIGIALEMGVKWVALFDQDSSVTADLFPKMIQEYEYLERQEHLHVAAIAPTFVDDLTQRVSRSLRHRLRREDKKRFVRVSSLATSGMLISAEAFLHIGGFNEELFLDFVDFEWCWRASQSGYALFKSNTVFLPHRLGLGERNCLGICYHIPAEYRHYFQFRDTLNLLFLGYAPLYDRLRLLVLLPLKLLFYPFILDHGAQRLVWMLLGIRDWVRGEKRIGAARARIG
ncbi:MAG: hypothetical protein PHN75_15135 [Syntrophales bacterium]|nr:hypothetical protein [Syntrophales bacterium]